MIAAITVPNVSTLPHNPKIKKINAIGVISQAHITKPGIRYNIDTMIPIINIIAAKHIIAVNAG